jgi:hypothetical protein
MRFSAAACDHLIQSAYWVNIFVKSSGDWLISEHSGRPLTLPPHG